ncbi:MAG: hypothetical protein IPJ48_10980 [Propionivibrio sp.]|uniref:Uncharacterized protein n=1 Tax=Candidatus Propionivibrio dominans TaxID=2954373 RepID=A0A9D7I7R7_9RHOO|nr:hypothetical protein [Candidatus Propionivibrio dominans]
MTSRLCIGDSVVCELVGWLGYWCFETSGYGLRPDPTYGNYTNAMKQKANSGEVA